MKGITADALTGPVRVLAGPGAGKTQLLVDLYTELIAHKRASRGEVLVLTFSSAAAEEISLRVDGRLRDSYDESWISTFHSFCSRLIRDHRPDPGRVLMSGFQEWLAMRANLEDLEPAALGPLGRVSRTDTFAQDALAFVAMLKQNRVHHSELALQASVDGPERIRALAAVYSAYQARCETARLRDFRDLISDAVGLLEGRPALLSRYRSKFRYVLVDEFQDVDPAQFHLLRVLAPPAGRPRLLVVGDPDQSIYGFRGTVPRLLTEEFPKVYGGDSLVLEMSHRCPQPVLEAGAALLSATQTGRRTRAFRSSRPEGTGPAVQVGREAGGVDEAFFVAREIRRQLLEDPGLGPGDVAVLLRSTTAQSAPFEEAVRALGLPYEVRGVGGMARNQVVRYLLNHLRAIADPDDPDSLSRLLGSGLSGVRQDTASRLRRYATEEGRPFARVVRRLLYWLRDTDSARYPLPWPEPDGAPPAEAAPAGSVEPSEDELPLEPAPVPKGPSFAVPMTEAELEAVHRAVTVYYEAVRQARRLPLAALVYWLLVEAGVLQRVLAVPVDEAERRESLAELRSALSAFGDLDAVWRRLFGAPPSLADIAPRLDALVARAVDEAEPALGRRDAVQIMTVHQSKGLQFESVFLSGFAEGSFPLASRPHPLLDQEDQEWLQRRLPGFTPSWPATSEEHIAEEARLAYVGMTRARSRLWLTYADEYERAAGPSPFLEPALKDAPHSELTRSRFRLDAGSVLTRGEAETLLAGSKLDATQLTRLRAAGADLDFIQDPEAGRHFEPYLPRPDGVDPDHFSPTALNDYLKCPRLYWYSQHPGLAQPARGVELARGSFIHEVLEVFHSREEEWRHQPPEAQRAWLDRVLDERIQGYLDSQEGVLERKAEEQEVRRILGNYIRFATSSQPIRRVGTLAVERRFRLDVDGSKVHGKIDRINDTGNGTCEVVDYKTGRGYSVNRAYESYFGPEATDVQLLMYYLACVAGEDDEGRPLGLRPRFLSLWYPKETMRYGNIRQVLFAVGGAEPGVSEWVQKPLAEEDVERGRRAVSDAIRRIREGDFAPAPKEAVGTCRSWFGCAHAAICPYGGGPPE